MISGEKSSIKHTAETYGVDKITLKSYFDKLKLGYEITSAAKRVLTTEEEKLMVDHIRVLDAKKRQSCKTSKKAPVRKNLSGFTKE